MSHEKPSPDMVRLEMDRILTEQRERQLFRPAEQDPDSLMEKRVNKTDDSEKSTLHRNATVAMHA